MPLLPDSFLVSSDTSEKALKRTATVLVELDKIRKQLEWPVEHMPFVINTYVKAVASLIAEARHEELQKSTQRLPLTVRSETNDRKPLKIKPDSTVYAVVTRPQWTAFRPEDITIHGDRSRWLVHDTKVGNRSQLVTHAGPIPGEVFGPGGVCERLRMEICETAMDFEMLVQYVGPEADGEVFAATVVGTAFGVR